MIHGIESFLIQHIFGALSAAAVLAAAAGFAARKLPAFAEKEVSLELNKVLSKIKDPRLKAFCVNLDKLAAQHFPDAGDAKYAVLTDLLIKECPAAAPARELILAVLTGLGAGAKAGLQDVAQQAPPS